MHIIKTQFDHLYFSKMLFRAKLSLAKNALNFKTKNLKNTFVKVKHFFEYLQLTIFFTAPGNIRNLDATEVNTSLLRVQWDAPAVVVSPNLNYTIQVTSFTNVVQVNVITRTPINKATNLTIARFLLSASIARCLLTECYFILFHF